MCEERREIAAYLDGELERDAARSFESHAAECALCRLHLDEQRRVLAVLEVAFGDESEIELPNEYAQIISARARNDLTGVRSRAERRRAIRLCLTLSVLAAGVLSAAGSAASLATVERFVSAFRVVGSLFGAGVQVAGDLLTGAAVLMRALVNGIPTHEHSASLLLCALFFTALALLRLLVESYRREHSAESFCD